MDGYYLNPFLEILFLSKTLVVQFIGCLNDTWPLKVLINKFYFIFINKRVLLLQAM